MPVTDFLSTPFPFTLHNIPHYGYTACHSSADEPSGMSIMDNAMYKWKFLLCPVPQPFSPKETHGGLYQLQTVWT